MSSNVTLFLLTLLLSTAVFAVTSAAELGSRKPLVGGWTPIKDLNDPHVQEIAQFAVSEYNSKSKVTLKLVKVLKGESQVVAGTNYRLVLDTLAGGDASQKYQALVWEKPWMHFRQLTSFIPVNQN